MKWQVSGQVTSQISSDLFVSIKCVYSSTYKLLKDLQMSDYIPHAQWLAT